MKYNAIISSIREKLRYLTSVKRVTAITRYQMSVFFWMGDLKLLVVKECANEKKWLISQRHTPHRSIAERCVWPYMSHLRTVIQSIYFHLEREPRHLYMYIYLHIYIYNKQRVDIPKGIHTKDSSSIVYTSRIYCKRYLL